MYEISTIMRFLLLLIAPVNDKNSVYLIHNNKRATRVVIHSIFVLGPSALGKWESYL